MSPLESPRTCPPMQAHGKSCALFTGQDLGLSNDLVRAIRTQP